MINFGFERLTQGAYEELLAGCTVIEEDTHGEKVLRTADGLIVKVFRRKRVLSTALLVPYAQRFVANAARLAERGVRTVEVCRRAYCPPLKRHLVIYRPLPGGTLRETLLRFPDAVPRHLAVAASFIASLHEKGVYFRSLHFGNVIVPVTGDVLGLIDIADLTFRSRPLPVGLRARNFRHLMRRGEDRELLEDFGCGRFVDHYLAASGMSAESRVKFLKELSRHLPQMSGDSA